jgi:UDP-N-acetylglucosamine 2-epimerase (non-hydrolysing)
VISPAAPAPFALFVGARPNLVKAWPLLRALERGEAVTLVDVGQHTDPALTQALSLVLGLRAPDVRLGESSGERPSKEAMQGWVEAWCREIGPRAAIVVGDVDATAAAGLGAHVAGVPVVHVEAGLRSGDLGMPEERNRIAVDRVADLLLASEPAGAAHLRAEGRAEGDVVLVGNVMIDTLLAKREEALAQPWPAAVESALAAGGAGRAARADGARYALLTLHRPRNVDAPGALEGWLGAVAEVAGRLPVVFPVHPRTRRRLVEHGLLERAEAIPGLHLVAPVDYLTAIRLQAEARVVLSDSGGVQEEASTLGTPCLTLRPVTERPITLEQGTAVLVPAPADLPPALDRVLCGEHPVRSGIDLWDGRAAERAAAAILARYPAGA